MAEQAPPPAPDDAVEPASSSASAAARELPATVLHAPSYSGGSRRASDGGARSGAAVARRGRGKGGAPVSGAGGSGVDRLVEAVRVVGRGVDPGVAGADILELAMAKGPMFSWLSYWPEEGYPKEDHPY